LHNLNTRQRMSANTKNVIIEKIQSWLKEEGDYKFEIKDNDAYSDFNILVTGGGESVNIILFKNKIDSVLFGTAVKFNDQDRMTYAKLKIQGKKPFLFALESALLQLDVVYAYHPNHNNLERIEIEKRVYFDALTKQTFFDTLHLIYRASTIVSVMFSNYLSRA
jgi:hypothetical protein